jgi:hypothetical protein
LCQKKAIKQETPHVETGDTIGMSCKLIPRRETCA